MHGATLTDVFRGLEHELAHLLRVDRFYIVGSKAAGVTINAECGGLTSGDLCWLHREQIGDRWAGAAPMALINTDAIDEAAPDVQMLSTIACHEAAHVIVEGFIPSPVPPDDRILDFRRTFHLSNIAADIDTTEPRHRESHGSNFVRLALHIGWRLHRAGWPLDLELLLSGCSVSSWPARRAVWDELEQLESLPLSNISDVPPPSQFAELFK